ncbi:hypothetical protein MTO96_050191 [Rhipicephalus appendiculatus]
MAKNDTPGPTDTATPAATSFSVPALAAAGFRSPTPFSFDDVGEWLPWLQQFEDYAFATGMQAAPDETRVLSFATEDIWFLSSLSYRAVVSIYFHSSLSHRVVVTSAAPVLCHKDPQARCRLQLAQCPGAAVQLPKQLPRHQLRRHKLPHLLHQDRQCRSCALCRDVALGHLCG